MKFSVVFKILGHPRTNTAIESSNDRIHAIKLRITIRPKSMMFPQITIQS